MRWHWRTPMGMPYLCAIQLLSVFSIPEIPAQTNRSGRVAQNLIHRLQLSFRQASRPSRSFSLQQARQTVAFKTTDPILHRSWRIAQKLGHLRQVISWATKSTPWRR
jgi:hypothetical protein